MAPKRKASPTQPYDAFPDEPFTLARPPVPAYAHPPAQDAPFFAPTDIPVPRFSQDVLDKGAVGDYARNLIAFVFEANGGAESYALWARNNPDDFFNKHFLKLVPTQQEVKHTTVDDLIHQTMIDATPTEANHEPDPE